MIKIKNYVDYYMNIIYQNLRINQFLAIIDWFPIRPAGCDDQTTDPPPCIKGRRGVITTFQF
jgi:hypothetical protein